MILIQMITQVCNRLSGKLNDRFLPTENIFRHTKGLNLVFHESFLFEALIKYFLSLTAKYPELILYDNHNRPITYVRLAVTDRCNLRCFYCMPEEGIKYLPKQALLSFEEIERLIGIMSSMGISKVRITGGEPFVRSDLMDLMSRIVETPGIKDVHLTTNGVLTAPHIPAMKNMGIASVNLSLDTLDAARFKNITRRNEFEAVMGTLQQLIAQQIPTKINAVVMEGKNIDDIIPLIELTKDHPIDVRFIEEMPFNGEGTHYPILNWTHKKILQYIQGHYPGLIKLKDEANSTSSNYAIPGYRGTLGVIAAFSRTFCGTCNRIRITAQGTLKTCLYDDGVLDVRKMMRDGHTNDELRNVLLHAFKGRPRDGFEAEANRKDHLSAHESMSTIGG
jgi:molybdenum cofactor biosynthesis protein A